METKIQQQKLTISAINFWAPESFKLDISMLII